MQIVKAVTPVQIDLSRLLFREYANWLGVDLSFQWFDEELASLPGQYAPPRGRLLLAMADELAAGCVAMRPLDDCACEMKRLYVRPAFRGQGLGMRLAETVIAEAKAIGFSQMRLDTLPRMTAAISLYEALGFTRSAAYYETPLNDTVFMELLLQ